MEMYNHDSDLQNSHLVETSRPGVECCRLGKEIGRFDRQTRVCWLWTLVQNVEYCKSNLILKNKSFRDGLTMMNLQNI